MPSEPTICLAGKNEVAVSALLYLKERCGRMRLVVCKNKTDEGISGWQPSLVRFAREYGIEIVSLEQAQEIEPLTFISLEFDRIIRPEKFKTDNLYNIHFSALPAYKGMYTSALPLLKGETQSGVTLHEIDSGIDTGSIISQIVFEISDTCTARDLYFLYMHHASELFRNVIDLILSGKRISARPQSAYGSSYFSKAAIDYGALKIDTKDTAEGILRQLKAFSFREYQIPRISGVPVAAWKITEDRSHSKPGTFVEVSKDLFCLCSIDYDLMLSRDRSWEWFEWLDSGEDCDPMDLDAGNIDIMDRNGWTPLIRAAYAGRVKACRILLERGADPNKTNCNGTTPLMYAYSSPNTENSQACAAELKRFGADSGARDRFRKSLHDYAHG